MSSQRGSAIITVMLMIAILALAGAALLLQSRMDTRMTRSQLSYDRTLSLGDGASKVSYAVLSIATTDSYTYNGHQTRKFVAEAGGQSTATSEAGTGTILTRGQDSFERWVLGFVYDSGRLSHRSPAGLRNQSVLRAVLGGGRHRGCGQSVANEPVSCLRARFPCGPLRVDVRFKTYGGTNGEPGVAANWMSSWDVVAPNQTIINMPVFKVVRSGS